jgi:RHS repeat-associated protein
MPSLPEETKDYDYSAVNQLLSVTNPNQTFVYDDDGNMIQGYTLDGYVFTATYDAESQMTSLEYTDSSSVINRTEYRYSGDGFLAAIRKFEGGSLVDEIRIVRDGFLAVQERDENNTVLREYTWGLNLGGGIGGLLNLKQGGQDYAYLYDGKGNVAAVIDASQAVVAAYRYAPFGKLLAKTGSLTQPFGFSTKRYDAQTGLIYYGYRFYGPESGRWLTRDPLGEAGGMNLYAFVGNNPVNWVDPFGLKVINNSDNIVYYKPSEGETPRVIAPHTSFDGEQDGVAVPCSPEKKKVFKSVKDIDIIIHQDGSITTKLADDATPSWWSNLKSKGGQAAGFLTNEGGGWKGEAWLQWLHDDRKDHGWDPLFESAQDPCRPIYYPFEM